MEGGTVEMGRLIFQRWSLIADVVYQTGNDFSYELGQVIPPPEIVNENTALSNIAMSNDNNVPRLSHEVLNILVNEPRIKLFLKPLLIRTQSLPPPFTTSSNPITPRKTI